MKHIRGLLSTTQALRHTFLSSAVSPSPVHCTRYNSPPILTQLRLYSTRRRQPPGNAQLLARLKQVKDEEIRSEYVRIVNEGGGLDAPVRLRDALSAFDRSENFLLQVSPGSRDQPPVCKIVSRVAIKEQERAKAKATHAAKTAVKQIELNWAIDAHDLAHRLKQLTTFLEKGRKVEVVLTRKKGKRAPTVEEVKHVMDSVMQTTREADAVQVRPMEGEPGKHVILVVKKRD
ncbi:translation initiation factor IF-3, C-terminal domain-containing protein [Aspergillus ambiguus]|uniref:putative translation initiation factor IF3 n=1 Tax=Aspergillus ambiguus TaxID=176160 RepID=UPI003CCE3EEB